MEDKLYLENIEEYVYDLNKIVTYKWLAMTLSVSFSEATRMLSEFVQRHSATPPSKEPLYVIYLITGVSRDTDNEKIIVSLADEEELEEIKTRLDEVFSIFIYSVQKGHHLKDRSSLQTAEHDVLQENLHNYHDLCSVKCTQSVVDQHSEVTVDRMKILDQHTKQDDQADKPVQQAKGLMKKEKKLDQHVKQDDQVDKPVQQAKGSRKMASNKTKPKGIAAMFVAASKQPKNATQKPQDPDKPACKQEEETKKSCFKEGSKATKVSSNSGEKLTQSTVKNSVGTITDSKFDKDVFTTEDDDDVVIKKDKEPKRSVTSNPVTAQVKEQKKGKNKKRRRVYQELSSGESDKDATGTNIVRCDKPSVQSVDRPAAGYKKRKIVRKLVDKMYIDEDGSMVTEKEWQEISTDDDDDEPVVATSNKTKTISSVKAKPKQSTLGAFFHKK